MLLKSAQVFLASPSLRFVIQGLISYSTAFTSARRNAGGRDTNAGQSFWPAGPSIGQPIASKKRIYGFLPSIEARARDWLALGLVQGLMLSAATGAFG